MQPSLAEHPYPPTPAHLLPRRPAPVRPGDVCDRRDCPAYALVRVITPRGPLGFCLHDMTELSARILAAGNYPAEQVRYR